MASPSPAPPQQTPPPVRRAPLRYCAMAPGDTEGWLALEHTRGGLLRARRPRYLRLHASRLACARAPSAPCLWALSVRNAPVTLGARPCEIIVGSPPGSPRKGVSLFAADDDELHTWLFALRKASLMSTRVEDYYRIGPMIGEGMNGQVREAHDVVTGEKVAVKMVPRLGRDHEDDFLAREVQIVLSLEHDNIVRVLDVFVRKRRVYFVMEFLGGGELFDYVSECRRFSEDRARRVVADLLAALVYLHDRGVVHRDVKLENLLTTASRWPFSVKLADFGFSNFVPDAPALTVTSPHLATAPHVDLLSPLPPPPRRASAAEAASAADAPADADAPPARDATLTSFVGTPYYIAPEMLSSSGHGRPVDLWATGVTLYILLSGKFPFGGSSEKDYYARVLHKPAYFPAPDWDRVTPAAKDLIRGLLDKDPGRRLTAREALDHHWFSSLSSRPHSLSRPSSSLTAPVSLSSVPQSPVKPPTPAALSGLAAAPARVAIGASPRREPQPRTASPSRPLTSPKRPPVLPPSDSQHVQSRPNSCPATHVRSDILTPGAHAEETAYMRSLEAQLLNAPGSSAASGLSVEEMSLPAEESLDTPEPSVGCGQAGKTLRTSASAICVGGGHEASTSSLKAAPRASTSVYSEVCKTLRSPGPPTVPPSADSVAFGVSEPLHLPSSPPSPLPSASASRALSTPSSPTDNSASSVSVKASGTTPQVIPLSASASGTVSAFGDACAPPPAPVRRRRPLKIPRSGEAAKDQAVSFPARPVSANADASSGAVLLSAAHNSTSAPRQGIGSLDRLAGQLSTSSTPAGTSIAKTSSSKGILRGMGWNRVKSKSKPKKVLHNNLNLGTIAPSTMPTRYASGTSSSSAAYSVPPATPSPTGPLVQLQSLVRPPNADSDRTRANDSGRGHAAVSSTSFQIPSGRSNQNVGTVARNSVESFSHSGSECTSRATHADRPERHGLVDGAAFPRSCSGHPSDCSHEPNAWKSHPPEHQSFHVSSQDARAVDELASSSVTRSEDKTTGIASRASSSSSSPDARNAATNPGTGRTHGIRELRVKRRHSAIRQILSVERLSLDSRLPERGEYDVGGDFERPVDRRMETAEATHVGASDLVEPAGGVMLNHQPEDNGGGGGGKLSRFHFRSFHRPASVDDHGRSRVPVFSSTNERLPPKLARQQEQQRGGHMFRSKRTKSSWSLFSKFRLGSKTSGTPRSTPKSGRAAVADPALCPDQGIVNGLPTPPLERDPSVTSKAADRDGGVQTGYSEACGKEDQPAARGSRGHRRLPLSTSPRMSADGYGQRLSAMEGRNYNSVSKSRASLPGHESGLLSDVPQGLIRPAPVVSR